MSFSRRAFRRLLGTRLPTTEGVMTVAGLDGHVAIGRDRYSIPHITANTAHDAWFALGFVHAQDRGFQIEVLQRVAQGTVAALIGEDGVGIDRLSRRVGLRRAGSAAMAVMPARETAVLEAYAAGINAGRSHGADRPPHEYALLRAQPMEYAAEDASSILGLFAFTLAGSWDAELARLNIVDLDGPEALERLDAGYADWHPTTSAPLDQAGSVARELAAELSKLHEIVAIGGASNNWAVAGAKSATGRPVVANDTHLAPTLPPHFYLAHLTSPDWSIAGATLSGAPIWPSAHNGHVAWGVTAGLVDNTDLFVEQIGPDGASVRTADGYEPCEMISEIIEVKGADPVTEDVLVTPRGPIISPAVTRTPVAISMAATWHDPAEATILTDFCTVTNVRDMYAAMASYSGPALNLVAADHDGAIMWQLIGKAPIRKSGLGAIPRPGWDPESGWTGSLLPYSEMPGRIDPESGWLGSANNRPVPADDTRFGLDWVEGYRMMRVGQLVAARDDWDVPAALEAQLDAVTPVWDEAKPHILGIAERDDVAPMIDLLRGWDGDLEPASPAAALFVMWLKMMQRRVAQRAAPQSWEYALGKSVTPPPLDAFTLFGFNRSGHLIALLRDRPAGWFDDWDEEIAKALLAARGILRAVAGDDPQGWAWGEVRTVTLTHPFGARRGLGGVFNLGPYPMGGDMTTVAQAGAPPLRPLGNPSAIASLRMAIDVGDWDSSRFSLPGGQSGNPLSPHYGDQYELWSTGVGAPMPWTEAAVADATKQTLHLMPG